MTGYVYLIGPVEGCYKIGYSLNPKRRARQLNLPVAVGVIHTIETMNEAWLEATFHKAFAHCHAYGEWYRLTDDDVARFKAITRADVENDLPADFQMSVVLKPRAKASIPLAKIVGCANRYTPEEVAEVLKIPKGAVKNLMDNGKLRYAKIGAKRLIPQSELSKVIADSMVQ